MSMPIKLQLFILFIMLLLMAVQCSSQPVAQPVAKTVVARVDDDHDRAEGAMNPADLSPISLEEGEKLRVVATTNIIGDLVGVVGFDLSSAEGGEAIELTTMIPAGTDPHTFIPSPRDVTAVADAHLVFVNGLGLETFLAALIENAGGEAALVAVSDGLETREFAAGPRQRVEALPPLSSPPVATEGRIEGGQGAEGETEHKANEEDESGHHHEGVDPHVWLTPANAVVMVRNIEAALSALDPANRDIYQANAGAYAETLTALDAWVMAQIETIPPEKRKLVTDHDAFGYYLDRYGLELIGAVIPVYSTEAEPSAQELAELQDAINEFDVKAIFVSTTVNPKLAEQVARDSGLQLVPLYTGSLGEAGSGVETYLDLIRYNTTAIVGALTE